MRQASGTGVRVRAGDWTPVLPRPIYEAQFSSGSSMGKSVTRQGRALSGAGTAGEVDAFLQSMAQTPAAGAGRGRLIFAMDATASREPTWDIACDIQAEMFAATDTLGGLEVQLVFYRGIGECRATGWLTSSADLIDRMVKVRCLGGRTQIGRVFKHAIKESGNRAVGALVIVGDAFEEAIDPVCELAGRLGLMGTKAFLFQEGGNPDATLAFGQFARLTGGACCRFDAGSAQQLRELLAAVAVYAAGGRPALEDYSAGRSGPVLQIARQIGGDGR